MVPPCFNVYRAEFMLPCLSNGGDSHLRKIQTVGLTNIGFFESLAKSYC